MRILIGVCLLGAVTTFGPAAIAADFSKPGLIEQMSLVVKIKDHHNGGKHHHGDNGDGHRCKGNSCKNKNAGGDGNQEDINTDKTTTPSTTPNSDVLWGDYKYVKP